MRDQLGIIENKEGKNWMEISGGIGYIGPKLPDITNFFCFQSTNSFLASRVPSLPRLAREAI